MNGTGTMAMVPVKATAISGNGKPANITDIIEKAYRIIRVAEGEIEARHYIPALAYLRSLEGYLRFYRDTNPTEIKSALAKVFELEIGAYNALKNEAMMRKPHEEIFRPEFGGIDSIIQNYEQQIERVETEMTIL